VHTVSLLDMRETERERERCWWHERRVNNTGVGDLKVHLPAGFVCVCRVCSNGEVADVFMATRSDAFLMINFRRVLNVVCFLLGNSPASEFYMPTFQNTLFHLHRQVGMKKFLPAYKKKEQTECSETFVYKIQTPRKYPEESIQVIHCWVTWSSSAASQGLCYAQVNDVLGSTDVLISEPPQPSKTTSVRRTVGVVEHKCIAGSYSLFLLNMTSWCRWLKCKVVHFVVWGSATCPVLVLSRCSFNLQCVKVRWPCFRWQTCSILQAWCFLGYWDCTCPR